mmetsp:Transcript_15335/g.17672  ORF Transcript_15335/g.17672 Transcript_15335/m.17672 type:complete len:87 (-) Transcript_15335:134-394(-)
MILEIFESCSLLLLKSMMKTLKQNFEVDNWSYREQQTTKRQFFYYKTLMKTLRGRKIVLQGKPFTSILEEIGDDFLKIVPYYYHNR